MRAEVQDWLRDWFRSRGKIKGQAHPPFDTDYFAAGWLTSMEVVEFVMEIEQRFNMHFSDQDLQDPRFVTIAGVAELVEERSAQTKQNC